MNNNGRIFISYRRNPSQWQAFSVYFALREIHKRTVFLDVVSIGSGNFEKMILDAIRRSRHFILILSQGTLDRCVDEEDFLRKEIEYALKYNRNIVPLFFENFSFENHIRLLEKAQLLNLIKRNGLKITPSVFSECIVKLNTRYLVGHHEIKEFEMKSTEDVLRYAEEAIKTSPDYLGSKLETPPLNKTSYITGTADFWKLNQNEENRLSEKLEEARKPFLFNNHD